MSYGQSPQQHSRPGSPKIPVGKRSSGGALILIVIAVVFMIMTSNQNANKDGSNNHQSPAKSGIEQGNVGGLDLESDRRTMPTTGRDKSQSKWKMEEVDSNPSKSDPKKTQKGNWKMEEVEKDSSGDVDIRLNDSKKKNDSKWKVEEVESSSKKVAGRWK